jgi:hypothetical protein
MPSDCELDLKRRWVKVTASGVLTYDDMVATRRKFTADPNFQSDFYQIYDVRSVTRTTLTASQIGELARAKIFSPSSRRAVVAPGSETYGLARMIQTYRELNHGKEQIKLFRTIEDAEAWLSDLDTPS